jgi:hypothetical protein
LQACRHLEDEGLLGRRAPRSGYFVRQPQRTRIPPVAEPDAAQALDPAQYVGVHDRVSRFVRLSEGASGSRRLRIDLRRALTPIRPRTCATRRSARCATIRCCS